MKIRPRPVACSGQRPAAELAQAVLNVTAEQSAALILPGLWGAEEILDALHRETAVLHVDGGVSDSTSSCPLIVALLSADIVSEAPPGEEVESHLQRWAEGAHQVAAPTPLVLLEEPEVLDRSGTETLRKLNRAGALRLVALLRTAADMPEFLRDMEAAGEITSLTPALLTQSLTDAALREQLGGPISAATLQRISALSGGHPVLTQRVLQAAQASEVLGQVGRTWMWAADEAPLHKQLAHGAAAMLSRLNAAEQNLVILLGAAGGLPDRWAAEHFGEEVVLSLRRQAILGSDPVHREGYLDLKLVPEAMAYAVRAALGHTEITRLWYQLGRHIPATSGGPGSEAALAWWAACAGERLSVRQAERASTLCIARSWYRSVGDIVDAAEDVTPLMRAFLARAQLALGHVGEATIQLLHLRDDIASTPGAAVKHAEAQRQAIIVARRLQVFHPETAEPVLSGLQALGTAGHAHHLERALSLSLEEDYDTWVRELAQVRLRGPWEEAIGAQLWLGTKLGLRKHPYLGRLLLASLLDDLAREGGHPDVEDAATAVLLLISLSHDWHTDLLRVDLRAWGQRPVTSPMLAGVADLVASMVAMQEDRMVTAHSHAASALSSFGVGDSYGLQAFASSLVAATASYVNDQLAVDAHRQHRTQIGPSAAPGLSALRLLSQGFAHIGSGPPTPAVAEKLVELAGQAKQEGEWTQEQQLLLLAMLGRSEAAARQVLAAPWRNRSGRTHMITLLAQTLVEDNDRAALKTAQLLISSGARFFGLAIIAGRWPRRAQMPRSMRVEMVRTVLTLRQQAPERSELLENFDDLRLTVRERAVVEGLLRGRSTRAIAQSLSLSPRTVESAISGLLQRFGCENRMELISMDLLPPES